MKFDTQSFPYPVLTPIDQGDDYIDGSFECVLDFQQDVSDDGTFVISYVNMLSVDEIQALISSRKANFVIEISCPETLFRKSIVMGKTGKIDLNAYEFHGNVIFTPMIVVTQKIRQFTSIDLNPEYESQQFQLNPGDLLAIDNSVTKNVDFIKLSFESMVRIRTDSALAPYSYSIEPTPNFIYVSMGEKLREQWTLLSKNKNSQPIFAMTIFKDCLVLAVEELVVNEDAVQYKWANALTKKLAERKLSLPKQFDFNEANRIAQNLVEHLGSSKLRTLVEA